jgi:HEAT repeat protein
VNSNLDGLHAALQCADEETRHAIIVGVRGVAIHESCALLFAAMGDQSWRVRKEAVDVFVTSHPEDSMINELLELLRSHGNAGLRNSAVEAIVKLGRRSMAPLVGLVHDPDADVRKFVIDAMGAIGSPFFYEHLLAALDDQDLNVADAAAENLGALADPRAVPVLIRTVLASSSDSYRFTALAALARLNTPADIPADILCLADNNFLQKSVYDCLGSCASISAVDVLVSGFMLRQISIRKAAVCALHKIYLRSDDASRRSIETALHLLSGGNTVPLLIELFDQDDLELSEAVIATLDTILDKRCAELFTMAMNIEPLNDCAGRALERLQLPDVPKVPA